MDLLSPPAPKRRKVRKGTRSCWECRRRKAKCIYSASGPDDNVCDACRSRGAKCVSQDIVDEGEALQQSKSKRRATISATTPPDETASFATASHNDAAFMQSNIAQHDVSQYGDRAQLHSPQREVGGGHEAQRRAPRGPQHQLTSIWDLRQSEARLAPSEAAFPSPPRSVAASDLRAQPGSLAQVNITKALIQAVSRPKDIEIIFEHVPVQSLLCFQSNYKSSCSGATQVGLPKDHSAMVQALHSETHPVLLARHMLELAVALRHFAGSQVIPGLSEHHHVIMERIAQAAIQLVTTNDALVGTLEGLENIILEAFYHVDSGNIRRAWITMRRAVMVGQLLGLHRPDRYRYKRISDEADLDPEIMWSCIINMESCLSMLLGLPTSTGAAETQDQRFDAKTCSSISPLLLRTTSRILQRNELASWQEASKLTSEIDHEIIQMSQQLPSTFWHPAALAGLATDSEEAFMETRRTWDLMCYYTLVNQLHLPYMLHADLTQIVYSRMACVNASREVLNRANALRAFNPHLVCCRMGDFMGLIAGMSLMLAHLVSHCHKEMNNLLAHQRAGDRAIVERALECMKSMFEVVGSEDALAVKCASLLTHLLAIEADAARAQSSRIQRPSTTNGSETVEGADIQNVLVVDVPYVGTISISQDGIMSKAPQTRPQHKSTAEDRVTIGGIGSLQVSTAGTPAIGQEQGVTEEHGAPQSANGTLQDPISGFNMDASSFNLDQMMFPDAAAGMDDWVLQGTDTAFFDVLMRSLDNQLEETMAGPWGTTT